MDSAGDGGSTILSFLETGLGFGVSVHAGVMFPAAVALMRCCCHGPLPTLCTPIKATKAKPQRPRHMEEAPAGGGAMQPEYKASS